MVFMVCSGFKFLRIAARDWSIYEGDLCFQQSGHSVQYVRRTTREAERQARSCNNNLEEIFLRCPLSESQIGNFRHPASPHTSYLISWFVILNTRPLLSFRESELLDLCYCWVTPPPKPGWFHLGPGSQLSGLLRELASHAGPFPSLLQHPTSAYSFLRTSTNSSLILVCIGQAAAGSERNGQNQSLWRRKNYMDFMFKWNDVGKMCIHIYQKKIYYVCVCMSVYILICPYIHMFLAWENGKVWGCHLLSQRNSQRIRRGQTSLQQTTHT